jgi:pimeloyl-ACP methyl ester carboxylesterase
MEIQSNLGWLERFSECFEPLGVAQTNQFLLPPPLRRVAKGMAFHVPVGSGVSRGLLLYPKNREPSQLVVFSHTLFQPLTFPNWMFFKSLLAGGSAVFAVELDGHGTSDAGHFDFQQASRSLPLVLSKLYSRLPNLPFILCGQSVGAIYSLLYAARQEAPGLIKALVVLSPALTAQNFKSVQKKSALAYLHPSSVRYFWSQAPYYGWKVALNLFRNQFSPRTPVRLHLQLHPFEQLNAFTQEFLAQRQILAQIKIPTLWIHGRKDMFVPFEMAERYMRQIQAPLFCHVESNKDHLDVLVSQRVSDYVCSFLQNFSRSLERTNLQ